MSNKLHIKSGLQLSNKNFIDYKGERLKIRMNREQIGSLIHMIENCEQVISEDDSPLETIILKEVKELLYSKYYSVSGSASVPFLCSQARTIFFWLNETYFTHPLEHDFSCWVVGEIYRQVV